MACGGSCVVLESTLSSSFSIFSTCCSSVAIRFCKRLIFPSCATSFSSNFLTALLIISSMTAFLGSPLSSSLIGANACDMICLSSSCCSAMFQDLALDLVIGPPVDFKLRSLPNLLSDCQYKIKTSMPRKG